MRIFGGNDNFENMFCASLRDFFFLSILVKRLWFSFRKGIWESFREGVCSLPIHCVGKVSGTHFFPLLNAFQLCSEALERLPPLGGECLLGYSLWRRHHEKNVLHHDTLFSFWSEKHQCVFSPWYCFHFCA